MATFKSIRLESPECDVDIWPSSNRFSGKHIPKLEKLETIGNGIRKYLRNDSGGQLDFFGQVYYHALLTIGGALKLRTRRVVLPVADSNFK